jgi:hypothetical protein
LSSRLRDLNEWLFHIDRLNGEASMEKECRNLLQQEIKRLAVSSRHQTKKSEISEEMREREVSERYFNIGQFKYQEYKTR